jgi:hypothetical protein
MESALTISPPKANASSTPSEVFPLAVGPAITMTLGLPLWVIVTVSLSGIHYLVFNRSKVQSSTFKVKEKEGIEDQKSLLNMLISPSNYQFSSKFWIRSNV